MDIMEYKEMDIMLWPVACDLCEEGLMLVCSIKLSRLLGK